MFAAEGLVVRYRGAGRTALDGVHMQVEPGTLYAILGPNGSGKSTLLKALLGAIPLVAGRVLLDGRPLGDWARRELARAVGVVAQSESFSFPLTVRELVAMGRYPRLGRMEREGEGDRAAIVEALERCDASALRDRDVSTLSGGELQRVRVARALAQEPRALALDEPTSSLDVRHEMAILALLRRLVDQGRTVLLVTHHLELAARFADRVLLLDGGRVAGEGPPAGVMTEATLSDVYRWPLAVREDPLTGAPRITPLSGPTGAP